MITAEEIKDKIKSNQVDEASKMLQEYMVELFESAEESGEAYLLSMDLYIRLSNLANQQHIENLDKILAQVDKIQKLEKDLDESIEMSKARESLS